MAVAAVRKPACLSVWILFQLNENTRQPNGEIAW
jgi:hypothetical protein